MRLALFLALLTASAAQALALAPALPPASWLGAAEDEEDEEEEEAPQPADAPKPAEGSTATAEPAAAPAAATPAPTDLSVGEQQRLVSGAPLYNPNVAVHIVEKKRFADRSKREIALYPATLQANGKFTQHIGSTLSGIYHLQENFAFQVSGHYNWYAVQSAFNAELIEKVQQEAQPATSLLLVWGAQAGVEVTPLYGKFAWYEDSLAHFSVVLNGGAGVGSTKIQLKPENSAGPATFGETGLKFLGSVGLGFRLQVGDRWAARLEVRDLVYTARVDRVNGCSHEDLVAMAAADTGGRDPAAVNTTEPCRKDLFSKNRGDINLAKEMVKPPPTSDVLNNVGVYAGFAFLF